MYYFSTDFSKRQDDKQEFKATICGQDTQDISEHEEERHNHKKNWFYLNK